MVDAGPAQRVGDLDRPGTAPDNDNVVVAGREWTLVLAGPAVKGVLQDNPPRMYRMLQAQARRLRNANRWRS